jgi:hypothetical protein
MMSDFDILTTTRAWVAVPWDFNSCIGLRFWADGSGDMVFDRLQILRAEINFSFTLREPNELILIYRPSKRSRCKILRIEPTCQVQGQGRSVFAERK